MQVLPNFIFFMSGLCHINDLFIFYNIIRITLKVSLIRIILSIGSLNGKNRLSEGHPRFLSNFPFVNLQIKSIVESLRPINLSRALNK